jgi:hypothetical protein
MMMVVVVVVVMAVSVWLTLDFFLERLTVEIEFINLNSKKLYSTSTVLWLGFILIVRTKRELVTGSNSYKIRA